MSALKCLPSATKQDIIDFISQTVENAASNPCPPIVLGVGIVEILNTAHILQKKPYTPNITKE